MAHNVSVVLSPTHLVDDVHGSWRPNDLRLCEALRHELDRAGGSEIAVDYQVITTNALLKDGAGRKALFDGIETLPIENVWLRTSGFGATATGAGTRSYIEALQHLHRENRPVVADFVGGFSALASAAFGAVGGISHGVGQRERFDANDWKRPPSASGGGSSVRAYVQELDRYFTETQLNSLFGAREGESRGSAVPIQAAAPTDRRIWSKMHTHTSLHRGLDR